MSAAVEEQALVFTVETENGTYTIEQREQGGFVDQLMYKNDVISVDFSDGNRAIESEQGTAYLTLSQQVKDAFLEQGFIPPEGWGW